MDTKLKEIIQKSGNNLHLEVAKYLEDSGWEVDLSAYYRDDLTDKPREIDIIAKKKIEIKEHNLNILYGVFHVYLFIECKYFQNEIAFRVCRGSEEDVKSSIILEGFNKGDIFDNTQLEQNHHYLKDRQISKLYDAPKDKREKTQEEVFQAVTQPVKSFLFFRDKLDRHAICYPLVVYQGISGIYLIDDNIDVSRDLDSLSMNQSTIFNLKYYSKDTFPTKNFCVDFIHQNELPNYLKMIKEKEIDQIWNYLFWKRDKPL